MASTSPHYNCQRFWAPRTATINLTDGGYLVDPLSRYGSILNRDVVTFDRIARLHCLALLGEPGIGKSTALAEECARQAILIKQRGDDLLSVDLRQFSSDVRLVEKVFRNDTVVKWLNGQHVLHLYLDSLDESLLRVETVAAILAEELDGLPTDRLYLRIASRTAEWPALLEDAFRKFWPNDQVGVYELTPLRRCDVVQAAERQHLDAAAFTTEVARREVVPLAIKPVTLNLLLNLYGRERLLPRSRVELYRFGCRLLCEETNRSRLAAGRRGALEAEARLAVAQRIAAITIFSNRFAIWADVDGGNVPDGALKISELCGGTEPASGREIQVDQVVVREVLGTGLFSARGPQEMGWSHQTFAEFLAAQYLVDRGFQPVQRCSLVMQQNGAESRVVPQLRETTAWLAGMVPDVFREVMEADPEILLRSDVATAEEADREQLVDALLALYDAERAHGYDLSRYHHFRKLRHPRLAVQLRPWLHDKSKGQIVRRVAVDIAVACEVVDLEQDLLGMALDLAEILELRIDAAYGIVHMGSAAVKSKLRPLAEGTLPGDPNDQLKGCALQALWPDLISATELFPLLTAPKNPAFIGAYHSFLHRDLNAGLKPADLPYALAWVGESEQQRHQPYRLDDPADEIMFRAWHHLDDAATRSAFLPILVRRLEYHEAIVAGECAARFEVELASETARRQNLVAALVPELRTLAGKPSSLFYSRTPLVLGGDLPWLIGKLEEASEEDTPVWVELIVRAYSPQDPDATESVVAACQRFGSLREQFAWLLNAIPLDSPEAHRLREDERRIQSYRVESPDIPLLDPPPSQRVAAALERFETGEMDAWWQLDLDLRLEPTGIYCGGEYQADLTEFPGWKAADDSLRARLMVGAQQYLTGSRYELDEWLDSDFIYRPALAGFRAFRLLLKEAPGVLDQLDSATWVRWAPILLAFPPTGDSECADAQQDLVRHAYRNAPDRVLDLVGKLVDIDNRGNGWGAVTGALTGCWDARIAALLLEKVNDTTLQAGLFEILLRALLERGSEEAVNYAVSLLQPPFAREGLESERVLRAAMLLYLSAPNAGWHAFWSALQADDKFACTLVLRYARTFSHHDGLLRRLSEAQLADLYSWLVDHYSPNDDPRHAGIHTVGPRESISHWRDSLLNALRDRGNREAVGAIARLRSQHPDVEGLKWTLLAAREALARREWDPADPATIIQLAANRRNRFVRSGEDLLEVIIEALDRLQLELTGETPAARDIWDEVAPGLYRPINENALSDYIHRHLRRQISDRGIITNREVQIRPGLGSSKGERTDIHVNAVSRGATGEATGVITAVIEVKGCWHPELLIAMETQLGKRYLASNHYRHGLYLVVWFPPDTWEAGDGRRKVAHGHKLPVLKARLAEQADAVSRKCNARIRSYVLDATRR